MTAHDSWAKVYDRAYQESFGSFYKKLTDLTLSVIQEETSKGFKIVDFGAGTGRLSCPLSELGYEMTAVDSSSEMLRELIKKDINKRINIHNAPMQNFTTLEKYDLALCVFSVLIYLIDEESLNRALSSLKECLKLNGIVLMDIPSSLAFRDLKYESSTLCRNVIIDKKNDIYTYNESIDVYEGDNWINYNDKFEIRCWSSETILHKMKQLGFKVKKDLSMRFAGSGASYFLFQLQEN